MSRLRRRSFVALLTLPVLAGCGKRAEVPGSATDLGWTGSLDSGQGSLPPPNDNNVVSIRVGTDRLTVTVNGTQTVERAVRDSDRQVLSNLASTLAGKKPREPLPPGSAWANASLAHTDGRTISYGARQGHDEAAAILDAMAQLRR